MNTRKIACNQRNSIDFACVVNYNNIVKGKFRPGFYGYIKRALDVVLALTAMFVLSPLFFIIAAAVRLDSGGPAIFAQTRVGQNGKPFTLLKFRTMYLSAPDCCPSRRFPRDGGHVTRIGAFLRRSSLDELPQLYNVLCGQMSLIGPRPVIEQETELLEKRRLLGVDALLPGITGLSQICGRDLLSDEEKASVDFAYLCRFSFRVDSMIFLKTILCVVRRDGIAGVCGGEEIKENTDAVYKHKNEKRKRSFIG